MMMLIGTSSKACIQLPAAWLPRARPLLCRASVNMNNFLERLTHSKHVS